ncbi:tubulin-specific chaperone C [Stomoxys calcitrans]|uniref:C-CAP/cofactor C-like domain-containing protein n=1 Tax=Stomoxys calcitrans TaxID=35570 RepID=A0A1I8NLV1_STOCA|nr:tubulin-specific chaperone C [Stomoxys calcitrans]
MNNTCFSLQNLGDDGGDGVSTIKKDQILERLNKRNKERQNYLDVKLEQRHKETQDSEGADYFSQAFADKVREIEVRVKNISEISAKKSVGEGTSIDIARHFTEITMEIQELQRYLTNSTMFLTDFKIKACQSIVNDLMQTCEEAKLKLMPKKKFGFSGRKVTPKPSLNPKLAKSDNLDGVDNSELPAAVCSSKVNWTLCNRTNEYICLAGDAVHSKDITIANLKNCFVELQGPAGSVQISHCSDCTFLCGPIARSLFADFCNNCSLGAACQQMRLHSSSQCQIYLHVTCRAIIEDCKHIEIAPYNYDYSSIEDDFSTASLNKELNNYKDVADFNWLSPDVPSPNWHLVKNCPSVNWNEKRQEFLSRRVDNASL